ELTFGDVITPETTKEECLKIKAYAAKKKIGLRTMASGSYWGMSLGSCDPAEREKTKAFLRQHLQAASWLGVETILIVPGTVRVAWEPTHKTQKYADVWKNSIASLKAMAPEAEKLGVRIGLENVWNCFVISPMEWKYYLSEIGSAWVGLYLDIGNCQFQVDAADYIEILKDKIFAIHCKNFAGTDFCGGLHGFGDDLLTGDVDFVAVKKALVAIDYTGTITAEMIPFSRLPDLVLPDRKLAVKTAQQMKQIW
ncbi:MAG: sugar phosphate isomerase/epimerase family protein, partial [Lentisphaeria bacterium]